MEARTDKNGINYIRYMRAKPCHLNADYVDAERKNRNIVIWFLAMDSVTTGTFLFWCFALALAVSIREKGGVTVCLRIFLLGE